MTEREHIQAFLNEKNKVIHFGKSAIWAWNDEETKYAGLRWEFDAEGRNTETQAITRANDRE